MNVLSLFDGMSCGQLALDRLGIKVDNYYASEIDKHAIEVTKKNFPNTIHLGDVTKVNGKDLPKIDLLLGGSPCQGFSFAGKQLNFDDPRSKLFFEFVRLMKECEPTYFLLENVRMKKEYQDVITEHMGVEPVAINSNLLSAQNRYRLYWTNIPNITQPEDKGIMLRDILQSDVGEEWDLTDARVESLMKFAPKKFEAQNKSPCLTLELAKGTGKNLYPRLLLEMEEIQKEDVRCGRIVGRRINPETGKRDDENTDIEIKQRFEARKDEKSGCLTTVEKDNVLMVSEKSAEKYAPHGEKFADPYNKKPLEGDKSTTLRTNSSNGNMWVRVDEDEKPILCIKEATKKGYTEIEDGDCFDATFINSKTRRGRNMKDKANCLTAANYEFMRYEHPRYRRLTPVECERLQTVPDNYTEGVSNTQRFRMLGNGWTVDVIAHILDHINNPREKEEDNITKWFE